MASVSKLLDFVFRETPETISQDQIINFSFVYDDKTKTLENLEDFIVSLLRQSNDIDKIKTFYLNHLDLFVKNQNIFDKIKNSQIFFDEYKPYLHTFNLSLHYIQSLNLYNNIGTEAIKHYYYPISQQIKPILPKSLTFTKRKTMSPSESFSSMYYPKSSIFYQVPPNIFAIKCHRIYLTYYFLIEMRIYQFASSKSSRTLSGYALEITHFYDNLYRKLEQEIDIFCNSNIIPSLSSIFITLTTTFLNLGNIPLAQICLYLIDRFKLCSQNKINKFLSSYEISLPLQIGALNKYKKFTYLTDPTSISKAFITAQELDNKIKSFSFIQKKLVITKNEILKQNLLTEQATFEDFIVFNYINPKVPITTKLYTPTQGIKFLCIEEKCKSQKQKQKQKQEEQEEQEEEQEIQKTNLI